MTEKERILKDIAEAMDKTPYGSITIELRGPDRPMDLVVLNRTRYSIPCSEPKKSFKHG